MAEVVLEPESDYPNVLIEAADLIYGDRHKSYGPAADSFTRTGIMVGALFNLGRDLTAAEVAMFFICHKLSRESYKPKRDNRVDIAGYAGLLDDVQEGR
jgi:uncharacterized protein DUF6378